MNPVMDVADLTVLTAAGRPIVSDIALTVAPGEVLAVVGESGSGKTTTALALLGATRGGARISSGRIEVAGHDMAALTESARRTLRGRVISYVPQDPSTQLNPAHRIVRQLGEALAMVGRNTQADRAALLERVNLPADPAFVRRYPFELSGGQQQRVAIAMALAASPQVVVLDEPTTGLDVTTQQRIIELVRELADGGEAGFVYISHDLALVSEVADRVAVMYRGRIVEIGGTRAVLGAPEHPFTRILAASAPGRHGVNIVADADGQVVDIEASQADAGALADLRVAALPPRVNLPEATPMLRVASLRVRYERGRHARDVLGGIDLSIAAGECVGLVGESGSGKSTLGRAVAGLIAPVGGEVYWQGAALAPQVRRRQREQVRGIQLVYQNPDRSLNPRESGYEAISRALRSFEPTLSGSERERRVYAAADRVRLPRHLLGRRPVELSGGEKQRVAIARALVALPDLLICDEVTSALDVSTQATIIQLLRNLSDEGLAILYITHDLGAVRSLAHRIAVLNRGEICEAGPCLDVLDRPTDAYTRELIASTPLMRFATK